MIKSSLLHGKTSNSLHVSRFRFSLQEDVFEAIEPVLFEIFDENKSFSKDKSTQVGKYPFPKIPYHESLENYGTDKPDLRNPLLIKDYTEVIKIDSGFYKAYHNRGVVYDLLGDLDKSIADYTSAIMLYPTYDQAYYNRARVYGRTGQSHKAIEDYTQAIAINPQNQGAYHNRGIIFAERGQIEKALSDLSRAIELNPQDGIAYYNRGKMYQVFGMNEESKADLQKSQELLSNQQE